MEVVAAAQLHLRELRPQLRVGLPVDAPAEAQVGVLHVVALPEQILKICWKCPIVICLLDAFEFTFQQEVYQA